MKSVNRYGRDRAPIYVVLAVLVSSSTLSGCVASTPSEDWLARAGGAQLVAREESHDFGTVESGPVVAHTFKLKNFGPDTIDIESVTGACGCTAILASTAQLAPGQEGGVEVALDTYKLTGEQAKTITVHSNDPVRPELPLTLHGFVATDVRAAPARLYFGRLPAGAVASQHVDVKLARPDVQITDVSSASGRLAVETSALDPPQSGVRVRVTLLPTSTTGTFDDRIVVTTNSARQPQITIPVLGTIERQEVYVRRHGDFGAR